MYTCAMKEVQTKFEVLSTEFKVRYHRNPISSISTRLKRTSSITEKMAKLQKPFSLECIEENIHDIAGIRVICNYYVLIPTVTVENWLQSNLIDWIVLLKVSYRLRQMRIRLVFAKSQLMSIFR